MHVRRKKTAIKKKREMGRDTLIQFWDGVVLLIVVSGYSLTPEKTLERIA